MINLITMIGALSLVSGGLGYFMFPAGLKMSLRQMVNLKENGIVFPIYMNPPLEAYSNYYIYQVTNPREFLNGGKLEVKLRGPYKFRSRLTRENIAFSAGGEKVAFNTGRRFFKNDKSGSLDGIEEEFDMLNPVVPTIMKVVENIIVDRLPFKRVSQPIIYNAFNFILDRYDEHLIKKQTPKNLLEGIKIELLSDIINLTDRFGITPILPKLPPENTFGLIHYQNVTLDRIEIYTGVGKTKEKFADMVKYRGKNTNTLWRGKCASIDGTNGELFKPLPPKNKSMRIFQLQLCRSIDLDPVGDGNAIEIQDGLMAYEYEITPRLFQGVKTNPSNKCYCQNLKTYDCQYDGLVNVSPCFLQAPVFSARANFKGVDKRIRRMIKADSLNEQVASDKLSLYLDPITGVLLKADINILGIIKVIKNPIVKDLSKIQNLTYAPLFLASEGAIIPYRLTWPLKLLQKVTSNYKPTFSFFAMGGSGILLAKLLMRGRKRRRVSSLEKVVTSNNSSQKPSPTPVTTSASTPTDAPA